MEQRGKGCGATTRRIHNDHKTNRQPPEYIQRQKAGIGINHSSAIKRVHANPHQFSDDIPSFIYSGYLPEWVRVCVKKNLLANRNRLTGSASGIKHFKFNGACAGDGFSVDRALECGFGSIGGVPDS